MMELLTPRKVYLGSLLLTVIVMCFYKQQVRMLSVQQLEVVQVVGFHGEKEQDFDSPMERLVKKPSERPTNKPTRRPTNRPTRRPTNKPTRRPTNRPTRRPTNKPTRRPTNRPTRRPTNKPIERLSKPTEKPTNRPIEFPTPKPTEKLTDRPTNKPTEKPTNKPTEFPTEAPTKKPTEYPTPKPTESPTDAPTREVTDPPTIKEPPPYLTDCREVDHLDTIFVVSNRRSGTHLTMDMLFNAFPNDMNIVKTNHIIAKEGSLSCECYNWMRKVGRFVHPYRNVLDMLISYFYYRKQYDEGFRHKYHLTSFMKSHEADVIMNQWATTVHSWKSLGDDEVLNLPFKDNVKPTRDHFERIGKFLNMSWGPSPSLLENLSEDDKEKLAEALFDRHNWKIVSRPVHLGAGKGNDGFREVLSEHLQQRLVEKAGNLSVWDETDMLKCPKEDFPLDMVCTNTKQENQKVLFQRGPSCKLIGNHMGNPLKTNLQVQLCVPNSCPKDLRKAYVISRFRQRTKTQDKFVNMDDAPLVRMRANMN